MKEQNKKWTGFESLVNTIAGITVSFFTQILIFPFFGINIPVKTNFSICAIFFCVSLVKNFIVRRVFNYIHKYK